MLIYGDSSDAVIFYRVLILQRIQNISTQQTQNIYTTFVQRRSNVFDVG